jgi:catechol 2,3-dioxygenase-like lactoylglutathione lyase family enzyme
MLTSRPIIAFVATATPARAKAFYQKTLGLRLVSEDGFALTFDAGGTMLRVAAVDAVRPAGYTVLGWSVPDLRREVRRLEKRGVVFQRYPGMPQDALGVWTSPSGACVAWFADPDGNTLSITQFRGPSTTSRPKTTVSVRRSAPAATAPLPTGGRPPAPLRRPAVSRAVQTTRRRR